MGHTHYSSSKTYMTNKVAIEVIHLLEGRAFGDEIVSTWMFSELLFPGYSVEYRGYKEMMNIE